MILAGAFELFLTSRRSHLDLSSLVTESRASRANVDCCAIMVRLFAKVKYRDYY